jgi:hypothetical protein
VLALAFATHVGMTVQLAGRTDAAALAFALTLGAFGVALVMAGRPLRAVVSMAPRARLLAAGGGLLLVLGAAAVVASARMTDAPAGSSVGFWTAGGWAAVAAVAAAVAAWRARARPLVLLSLAGGVAVLAGVAGVVADWERPSSFSPLVRFAPQEMALLIAGVFAVVGALILVRSAREGSLDDALVCAAAAGAGGGLVWWVVEGMALRALSERPVEIALASLAWGAVCASLPRVLRSEGPARSGAMLALAPILLTALIGVEQLVGVAGPQPMIVRGVVAGGLVLLAGAVALWWSRLPSAAPGGGVEPPSGPGPRYASLLPKGLGLAALALATVGLATPALTATANVSMEAGRFVGSWTLLGWESVAGVSALALVAVAGALVRARRPAVPAAVALAACAAWSQLADVPMHVLTGTLTPGIEQYYGTEYGSITFVAVTNWWFTAAVILASSVLVILVANRIARGAAHGARVEHER